MARSTPRRIVARSSVTPSTRKTSNTTESRRDAISQRRSQRQSRSGSEKKRSGIDKQQEDSDSETSTSDPVNSELTAGAQKKIRNWSQHATKSPYPDFKHPTEPECRRAHTILQDKHSETVRKNFAEDAATASASYPFVLDALTVATLSQATSWSNAKRAMASMSKTYGSPFEYDAIVSGGVDKLATALRPGGMHNRKSKMLLRILEQVKERHGEWNLNHLFNATDDDAVRELISYDGVGTKSAYCVLSICLQRNTFAVDTHIYRIAGLWGWRPQEATRELAQAHLDARIPADLKFSLHYLLIVHGRECAVCRAKTSSSTECEVKEALEEFQSSE